MITAQGKHYLYRHIREDKNEVFYVGIGTKTKEDDKYGYYTRANQKGGHRSGFWKIITSKATYAVEIILESNDRKFIEVKEQEFIKLYGRKDLNEGTLVNLNDGGAGLRPSLISLKRRRRSMKKTGADIIASERARKNCEKNRVDGKLGQKKTFLYDKDGIFVRRYASRKDCCADLNIEKSTLESYIKNKENGCGYFISSEDLGSKLNISLFRIKNPTFYRVVKICPLTYDILEYADSGASAAKKEGVSTANFWQNIKQLGKTKAYFWAKESEYEKHIELIKAKKPYVFPQEIKNKQKEHLANFRKLHPEIYSKQKPIINIETKQEYIGISEIVNDWNYTANEIRRMLQGYKKNVTPFIYIGQYKKENKGFASVAKN